VRKPIVNLQSGAPMKAGGAGRMSGFRTQAGPATFQAHHRSAGQSHAEECKVPGKLPVAGAP